MAGDRSVLRVSFHSSKASLILNVDKIHTKKAQVLSIQFGMV